MAPIRRAPIRRKAGLWRGSLPGEGDVLHRGSHSGGLVTLSLIGHEEPRQGEAWPTGCLGKRPLNKWMECGCARPQGERGEGMPCFPEILLRKGVNVSVAQSGPVFCALTDCSPPGSSVPGIIQARI